MKYQKYYLLDVEKNELSTFRKIKNVLNTDNLL